MTNSRIKLSSALLLLLLTTLVLASSCTKNENHYYIVENVNVTLNSKELLKTRVRSLRASAVMSTNPIITEHEHKFPSSYTAYFISKETKGEYTTGQLVKTINVTVGNNTITVPKLNYDVIITNYSTEGDWYTWGNAVEQLPTTSHELYLYGKNNINYSQVTEGTVELNNPYAAVMIKDNRWVNGYPKSYTTNQEYFNTHGWYIMYIRGNDTNTMIPISIAGNSNTSYTLSKHIEANNIYQYTIDGSVPDLEDGNLGVIVKPFEKIIEETIRL